jgi:hypothetical protein
MTPARRKRVVYVLIGGPSPSILVQNDERPGGKTWASGATVSAVTSCGVQIGASTHEYTTPADRLERL